MMLAFAGGRALRSTSLSRPVQATTIAVGLLWLVCAATLAAPRAHGANGVPGTWWCMAGMSVARPGSSRGLSAALAGLPMAMVMVAAMTLPAALPAVHHVALNSLRSRHWRAVAEFLIIYLGFWLGFVSVSMLLLSLLGPSTPDAALAAMLGLCALWELTGLKLRALNRCHRSWPLPPRGIKATLGTVRFAALNASGCIGTCAPAMLAMLIAPRARLAWMIALSAIAVYERLSRMPRKATRRAACAYAAATAGATVGVLVA